MGAAQDPTAFVTAQLRSKLMGEAPAESDNADFDNAFSKICSEQHAKAKEEMRDEDQACKDRLQNPDAEQFPWETLGLFEPIAQKPGIDLVETRKATDFTADALSELEDIKQKCRNNPDIDINNLPEKIKNEIKAEKRKYEDSHTDMGAAALLVTDSSSNNKHQKAVRQKIETLKKTDPAQADALEKRQKGPRNCPGLMRRSIAQSATSHSKEITQRQQAQASPTDTPPDQGPASSGSTSRG